MILEILLSDIVVKIQFQTNKIDNEDAYRPLFFSYENDTPEIKKLKIRDLTVKHWNDFSNFEGNAMGFRIINNPHYSGFNLTYSTIAAFTKYPRESYLDPELNDPILVGQKIVEENNKGVRVSQKKYGFFQSEKDKFKKIADNIEGVGLIELGNNDNYSWCRYPLSFLVEAADDLCNKLIDFEDGFRLGRYDFDIIEGLLNSIVKINIKDHQVYINLEDNNEKICYLRGKALFILANELSQKFLNLESDILDGKYDSYLIEETDHIETLRQIDKKIREGLFKYLPILEIETVGFEVIGGLIHLFLLAVTDDSNLSPKHREKIKQLLPNQFKLNTKKEDDIQKNLYTKIQLIIDYIAGMSDTYALQTYRKLKGIDIPRIQNIT
jgi:dGTPase